MFLKYQYVFKLIFHDTHIYIYTFGSQGSITIKAYSTDMFLLFDYVHLFKCIRNNWITEKTQELEFFMRVKRKQQNGQILKPYITSKRTN